MIECISHNLEMKLRVTKESWLKLILGRQTARIHVLALPCDFEQVAQHLCVSVTRTAVLCSVAAVVSGSL